MKKTHLFIMKVIILLFISFYVSSCSYNIKTIDVNENELPPELKGLKIYKVCNGMSYVKVAVLNDQLNSTTYPVGKSTSSTIIINQSNNKVYYVKNIIIENDSIIVAIK